MKPIVKRLGLMHRLKCVDLYIRDFLEKIAACPVLLHPKQSGKAYIQSMTMNPQGKASAGAARTRLIRHTSCAGVWSQ